MTEDASPTIVGNLPVLPVQGNLGSGWSRVALRFLLAIVGGAFAWGIMQATSPVFLVPEEYHLVSLGPPPEKVAAFLVAQAKANRQNAMLDLSWVGALVAGMLGLGESISRRRWKPVLVALPIGAAAGSAAGLVGSFAHSALNIGALPSLTETVALQIAMLGTLGAGIGLALGLSTKTGGKVVAAGLLAGILAGVLYPVTVSILLPTVGTDTLIPKGAEIRIVWIEISAGLVGLVTTLMSRPESLHKPPE